MDCTASVARTAGLMLFTVACVVTMAKADWLPQYSKDALAKPGRTPGPSAKKPSKPDLPKNANHKRRVATKNFIASKHL
ncbi:hypothetical protein AAVH_11248 [Aphelenchoides avenae]|nr:hypothetical protein AAVH_11248 [Aphelenchus avenae]